ncbi:hypothetical protein LZG04_15480 [Saccharothrix sp. S26]|uniref:IS3 family transposase n=1 Tax=Saccharothrix sp. S26 TaxID=2907215 RepID=UPI001F277452|nr:IS3 family transposase [Saccharothrix sp. S26]MCE6996192.1 hypothetical protein [Saccharothrix sp. S26]
MIVAYIDAHKHEFGAEPICAVPPSAREVAVARKIMEVHEEDYGVYGIRKVHAEMSHQGGVGGRPSPG